MFEVVAGPSFFQLSFSIPTLQHELNSWRALFDFEIPDMLTLPTVLGRSVRLALILLVADGLAAYGLTFLSFRFIEIMGDLMLIEVAILFVLAGLLDVGTSIGAAQFRKTILGSKEGYSSSKHKDAERTALLYFLGGMILFLILIVFAIYEQS